MPKDIRLHGVTDNNIEYFLIAAGAEAHRRFFFNIDETGDGAIRVFSPGNELVLGPSGILHRGNGGSFCEYMFGVDQPMADLAKSEVINRLVMYGACYEKESGSLVFGDRTDGTLSFEKIFFDGNALCNYFFFINSSYLDGSPKEQQEMLLKLLGKSIKRSPAVGAGLDNTIIDEMLLLLDNSHAQLFLFKLINRRHLEYHKLFEALYLKSKKIADEDFALLTALAAEQGIDRYQQERIRIDVMYKHPDNRRIVDEYKNILISCNRKGEINKLENARLTRLKTLSVRNKIPGALFYTLDELLKKDKKVVVLEESDYISETRQIMEGIFLAERQIESAIDRDDMVKLLFAKKNATENREHAFEEILLDSSKLCDEKIRDGADASLLEGFSHLITYFDRYDSTSSIINQLAFMENVRITEDMIRSILGNKHEFDILRSGLFEELFITGITDNKYLGKYGYKKLITLIKGLKEIEEKRMTTVELLSQLLVLDDEERTYLTVLGHVRERIRNFYSKYSSKIDQDALKKETTEELHHRKLISGEIPDALFNEAILTIKKEAIYLHSLLPEVIEGRNVTLREDFLENSGLDRFYIEELEREYFELNELDLDTLYQIRKGLT